ncbi:MAG: hypothetical protein WA945_11250 [Arcobacteraceae bacterium]
MKILNADEIFTLSIKVTEPIGKRYILSSLRTAIKSKTPTTPKNCHFQFYYNISTLTYEVLFYEKTSEDIVLEPGIIIANKSAQNNNERIKVFVTDGYLVVTKNQEILIFKEITAIEDDEIILYLKQIYKIDDFELIRVSDEEIKNLDTSIDIPNSNKKYPLDESKAFKIFTILCASGLLFLVISIYFTYYADNKSVIVPTQKEIIPQVKNKIMILNDSLKLFENISTYKIGLEKVNYRNSTITTTLSHFTKSALLEFTNHYKKRLKIKSLKFDESEKLYVLEVTIEY